MVVKQSKFKAMTYENDMICDRALHVGSLHFTHSLTSASSTDEQMSEWND
jgi:hypothetical protein